MASRVSCLRLKSYIATNLSILVNNVTLMILLSPPQSLQTKMRHTLSMIRPDCASSQSPPLGRLHSSSSASRTRMRRTSSISSRRTACALSIQRMNLCRWWRTGCRRIVRRWIMHSGRRWSWKSGEERSCSA